MNEYSVFDIETDGLLDKVTKIHCLSVQKFVDGEVKIFSTTDYNEMISFFTGEKVLVGHNIIKFDIPVVKKILGIEVDALAVDTLGLSWYLYPERDKHGLEEWGKDLGIQKPIITDWNNLSSEDYIFRCSEDVRINVRLLDKQIEYLSRIYNSEDEFMRIIRYIGFKLDCAAEQEQVGWKLDYDTCKENYDKLLVLANEKKAQLSAAMPYDIKYKQVIKPNKVTKKDGSLFVAGENWFKLLEERAYPISYDGVVNVMVSEEPGNAGSVDQIKSWLYGLGWVPQTYKIATSKKTGETKKVPQIKDGAELCKSVLSLMEKEPAINYLNGLTILTHRLGILKGFLENCDENHYLKAEIKGLTNTLRFQHTTIVNLPTVHKPYGKEVRSALICEDDELLCGSDMSNLENNTKLHYMWFYDPDYVAEMSTPGFDSHLDIALQGGMLTEEQVEACKLYMSTGGEKGEDHTGIRKDAKVVNFSAVYGVGAPKMSLGTGWPLSKSKKLLEIYWKRNWSVKQIAKDCIVKTVDNQMWLFNPVSHFWYTLRYDKDRFSTLNQGTGVYCFDTWVRNVRKRGIKVCGQFHDEIIVPLKDINKDIVKQKLEEAIQETNDELNLNIKLSISVAFNKDYASIH